MNNTTKKGRSFTQLSKPLVAVLAIIVGGLALALTDAGTVIKNLATVTYTDSADNEYIATSNEAQVTVAEVHSAILFSDNSVSAPALTAGTVNLIHTIVNTGNASNTYLIAATDSDADIDVDTGDIFVDTNGNGQIDALEPSLASLGDITPPVGPGESLQLIFAIEVPSLANAESVTADITATGVLGGAVLDENADGTGGAATGNNRDLITFTNQDIIETNKSSSFDGTTLTYTLSVTNSGAAAATNLQIFDALPAGTNSATFAAASGSFTNILVAGADDVYVAGGTFTAITGNLAAANLTTDLDEPSGVDMNGNGVTGETDVNGFMLRLASLASGQTASLIYTIDVLADNAGDVFKNVFCAGTGITGVGVNTFAADPNNVCSNQTIDQVGAVFDVQITDTADVTQDGTNIATGNGGQDLDSADNDVQYIEEANMADIVEYKLYVKNNGTRPDIFDITTENDGTFPAGTVFTFWNESGNVPLADNNNNGTVDVGQLAPNEDAIIVVKAHLPVVIANAASLAEVNIESLTDDDIATADSGAILGEGGYALQVENGEYFVDVNEDNIHTPSGGSTIGNPDGEEFGDTGSDASSLNNSEIFAAVITLTSASSSSVSDQVIIALGKIVAYRFDLANSSDITNVVPLFDNIEMDDGNDAHNETAGLADVDDAIITVGNNDFNDHFDENGSDNQSPVSSGNGAGDAEVERLAEIVFPLFIRNNGSLEDTYTFSENGGALGFTVTFEAVGGGALPVALVQPGNVFSFQAKVVVNSNALGPIALALAALPTTHQFNFVATSAASSTDATDLTDTVIDGIIVEDAFCNVVVSGAAPLEVGAGGTVDFRHTLTNDFNETVTYTLAETVITEDETAGWTSEFRISDGTALLTSLGNVTTSGTDAIIVLTAGQSITFLHRIDAPAADVDESIVANITITNDNANCGDEELVDKVTVTIDGVTLTKQVALDVDCDCASATADDSDFSIDAGDQQPGVCVIWRLLATNTSASAVTDVVVRDPLSPFTVYQADGIYTEIGSTDVGTLPGFDPAPIGAGGTFSLPTADQFKACSEAVAADCTTDITATLQAIANGGSTASAGASLNIVNGEEAEFSMGTLGAGDSAAAEICVQVQ